jgi:hypothetical protein
MKWRDPMPVCCPSCGRQGKARVAELRSLRAVCPHCGGSLAATGERMLAEEARLRPVIDRAIGLCHVIMHLEEHAGLTIPWGGEGDGVESLGDLVRVVAGRLGATAEGETRAAELVAGAARQVAPWLLDEAASSGGARG